MNLQNLEFSFTQVKKMLSFHYMVTHSFLNDFFKHLDDGFQIPSPFLLYDFILQHWGPIQGLHMIGTFSMTELSRQHVIFHVILYFSHDDHSFLYFKMNERCK